MAGEKDDGAKIVCRFCSFSKIIPYGEKLIKRCPKCNRMAMEWDGDREAKNDADLSQFIFDPDKIVQRRVFTSHILEEGVFAFGILLPKVEDVKDNKGNVVNKEQLWKPVIITSDKRGIPVTKMIEIDYRIRYEDVPAEMSLRWDLRSINNYLTGKPGKIDGLELFNRVRGQYEYYNYYREKAWYDVNALWDIGTYFHQLFSAFPIKEERGFSGTGKSKSMVVSSQISLNATDIMINPSEATLFRITESVRATKYLDEAEKLFKITIKGIESDGRVELINSSYISNGAVARQEKTGEGKYVTKWYHVYSPTRIGSINGLYGATENRAITQVHTKAPGNVPQGNRQPEDDMDKRIWAEIRNDIYLWALQNWARIREDYVNFEMEINIKQRDLQLWKPLIVISKIIDPEGLTPKVIAFAEKLTDQRRIESLAEGSLDYQLLDCVNRCIPTSDNKVYVERVRTTMDEAYPMDFMNIKPRKKGYNRTITARLDKMGFVEFKGKDRIGAYYQVSRALFDDLVTPITTDFLKDPGFGAEISSQSSQSSQLDVKQGRICDDGSLAVTQNEKKPEGFASQLNFPFSRKRDDCDAKEPILGFKPQKEVFDRIIIYMENSPDPKVLVKDMEKGLNIAPDALKDYLVDLDQRGHIFTPSTGYVRLVRKEAKGEGSL